MVILQLYVLGKVVFTNDTFCFRLEAKTGHERVPGNQFFERKLESKFLFADKKFMKFSCTKRLSVFSDVLVLGNQHKAALYVLKPGQFESFVICIMTVFYFGFSKNL